MMSESMSPAQIRAEFAKLFVALRNARCDKRETFFCVHEHNSEGSHDHQPGH